MASPTKISKVSIGDDTTIFYRSAGSPSKPTILLLHGFPSSSHQYRNLIPLLATKYHVVAPDIPGFGFTTVPASYKYTFQNFAVTIGSFLDALKIEKFAVYIFDYGAPTALRLALLRPKAITAIIAQNGNAYEEGLGAQFWGPFQKYWKTDAAEDRTIIKGNVLTYEATKWQYEFGTPEDRLPHIAPETYTLDWALMREPADIEIQLDIFKDYGTNLAVYPKIQEWFRTSKVPLLAVYGKHDLIFPPAGAEAYKKDLPEAEIHLLDAGHFAVESHTKEIADYILEFLPRKGV